MLRVTSLFEAVVLVDPVMAPGADDDTDGNDEAGTLSGSAARPV
jgi:hypothetical protein